MNKLIITITVGISLLLGGCGIKERAIDLKNRFTKPDPAPSSTEITSDQSVSKQSELTGMLLILDPSKCPLAEGCGPNYSLLGRNLKSQVSIAGEIKSEHQNLVVSIIGDPVPISSDRAALSGYQNISAHVEVEKYRLRSSIPYYPFLIEQASRYTEQYFGCDLLWDKTFSWSIENDVTQLAVKMTNNNVPEPYPWLQLIYDGNTGELIDQSMSSSQGNPCQS